MYISSFIAVRRESWSLIWRKHLAVGWAGGVLWLFKAGQVHVIRADGRIFVEPWGCLTSWGPLTWCLYSGVGRSMWATGLVLHQKGAPTPFYTKCTQNQQGAKILYNKEWFGHAGPLKVMGILPILAAQTSGWGSLTGSVSPTGGIGTILKEPSQEKKIESNIVMLTLNVNVSLTEGVNNQTKLCCITIFTLVIFLLLSFVREKVICYSI